jgi:hypothetical protein
MNEKQLSQSQKVINMLSEFGEVSNLWAIKHYILRLSDIIFRLRQQGWQIEGEFLRDSKGRLTKIYNYKLSKSRK